MGNLVSIIIDYVGCSENISRNLYLHRCFNSFLSRFPLENRSLKMLYECTLQFVHSKGRRKKKWYFWVVGAVGGFEAPL